MKGCASVAVHAGKARQARDLNAEGDVPRRLSKP
jgi:hypothetical protein